MTDETNSDQPVSDQLANGPRSSRRRQVGWGLGLLAGGALAGAILAGSMTASADNTSTPGAGSSSSGTTERGEGHRGHGREQVLTGDTAAKVKAAALAKVPGATVDRLEKDSDGAVYEAHLTKADGSRVTVKLDAAFAVTGVETGGPGDRDHGGPGGRGHDEVALTGSAAAKARAAALAELPGATVERVEKDADGATYEAHVRKADGTEATVKMDAGYTVTGVEAGR